MSAASVAPEADRGEGDDLALIVAWIATSLDDPDPGAAAEAEKAADELAADLAALAPEVISEFVTAKPVPDGALAVLERVPGARLADVADALYSEPGADPDYLQRLCAAAVTGAARSAASAADVLLPLSLASTLLVASGASGEAGACIRGLAEAAGAVDGDPALASLVAACQEVIAPSTLTRPLAALVRGASRFGAEAAAALARGHLLARLLAPALTGAGLPEAGSRLAAQDPADPLITDIQGFADALVRAGQDAERIAAAGEDPDDFLTQRGGALASEVDLHLAFAVPTPPDPLGTLPATSVTALGQAIRRARALDTQRYDWARVQELQDRDPDGFGVLLTDERTRILDRAAELAGITLE